MIDWIIKNWIEIFAALSGLIYLYLEIKGNILIWPLGILTSSLYIIVFYNSGFFADMALNLYYVLISIYGWYLWSKNIRNDNQKIVVKNVTSVQIVILTFASVLIFLIIHYILYNHTTSTVPFGDSFTTALSIVATWMLAKRIIEQWFIWIVVNIVSLSLYIYKGLYPTVILFAFYTLMSFVGYFEWKKLMLMENHKEN